MSEFRLNKQSAQDLEHIADYYGERDAAAAVNILEELFAKCEYLADFPGAGQRMPSFGKDVRVYPAGSHVIYYIAKQSGVEIARIVHGARDFRSLDQE